MKENRIEIKGDKEGISVIVDIDKFKIGRASCRERV